jgi:hypothetical protein
VQETRETKMTANKGEVTKIALICDQADIPTIKSLLPNNS